LERSGADSKKHADYDSAYGNVKRVHINQFGFSNTADLVNLDALIFLDGEIKKDAPLTNKFIWAVHRMVMDRLACIGASRCLSITPSNGKPCICRPMPKMFCR
jgi:hypothetical protein